MRSGILFFLIISFYSELCGQISFREESKVEDLMRRYTTQGKEDLHLNGWRIKIISTTDRRQLENTKYLFERRFPELTATTSYENPYYSIKVGAFENRFDLEPQLVEFKEVFPGAIPFRDRIMKSEFDSE